MQTINDRGAVLEMMAKCNDEQRGFSALAIMPMTCQWLIGTSDEVIEELLKRNIADNDVRKEMFDEMPDDVRRGLAEIATMTTAFILDFENCLSKIRTSALLRQFEKARERHAKRVEGMQDATEGNSGGDADGGIGDRRAYDLGVVDPGTHPEEV